MDEGGAQGGAGFSHRGGGVAVEAKGGVGLALGLVHRRVGRGVDDGGGLQILDQRGRIICEQIASLAPCEREAPIRRKSRTRQFLRHLSRPSEDEDQAHIHPRHLNQMSGTMPLRIMTPQAKA